MIFGFFLWKNHKLTLYFTENVQFSSQLSQTADVQALQIEKDNLRKELSEKEGKIEQLMHLICISSKIVLSPKNAAQKNIVIVFCCINSFFKL